MRRTHTALRRGGIRYAAADGPLLAFTRSAEGETILTAANNSEREVSFPFRAQTLRPLLDGTASVRPAGSDTLTITLPPMTGGMWLTEKG